MGKRKQTVESRNGEVGEVEEPCTSSEAKRRQKARTNAERQRLFKERQSDDRARERRELDASRAAASRLRETEIETENRRQMNANRQIHRIYGTRNAARRALATLEEFDETRFERFYAGQMTFECTKCHAKHFKLERPQDKQFNVCCGKGKISLPVVRAHQSIIDLLSGEDVDSKMFLENIRSYNSAFAFASVGATIDMPPGVGPYCFRIHGQIYHLAGTLHPEAERRKYAQMYVLDGDEANRERLNDPANEACKEHIMAKLHEIFKENQFAQAYKMLYEVEREELHCSNLENRQPTNFSMSILQKRDSDIGRYNPQASNEVAFVFVSPDGEPPFQRDLLIHLRAGITYNNGLNQKISRKTQRISVLNTNLDALTYPIMFPYGEQGWAEDLAMANPNTGPNSRKRVSLKEYYSYRFQIRDNFNVFLRCGRLTQQYVVDAYVKAESNDLNYHRTHQKDMRCDQYKDLNDFVNSENQGTGMLPGKKIILPSSFSGSPRNMQQHYQDAMAIVRKFGKPDLFITMTCNPKWREITENLARNERAENRPDLTARVFKVKLTELLNDIVQRKVLGATIAKVHVIEFQKRGLPHAHIVIFLKEEDKPRTAGLIDKIVSAELPDIETQPQLYDTVKRNMIHGPCGEKNMRSPCMVKGKCSKGFPKRTQIETQENSNGYPIYRRREIHPYKIGKHEVDNTWVVPYNPYLSLKFDCHINLEVCRTIKSMKYLFKYAYKGFDAANIEISADEIKTHVDCRYVSPNEAMWRILRFHMQDQSHTVARLNYHLEHGQNVAFDSNDLQNAIVQAGERDTEFTAWFKLNETDAQARQYLYSEIPENYIFESTPRVWKTRKIGKERTIGRIHNANIKDKERYFLRMILLHKRGATSFEDLRTYNGTVYESYYDTAKAMGLVLDETVWDDTLMDACGVGMPKQLRDLFAFICIFSEISDASGLWEKHREFLVEDFARRHGHASDEDCNDCDMYCLMEIENTLLAHGKFCQDYCLKQPPSHIDGSFESFIDMEEMRRQSETLIESLNAEQRAAFDEIMDAIDGKSDRNCFFLDGPGGSGKTYLYKALITNLRGQNKVVVPVASTGIAANLLPQGRTYHSQFKVPLKLNETSVSGVKMQSFDAGMIRIAKLIIWDEATMAPDLAARCIDKLLRDIMQNDLPFGGKVVLKGGDFRQCLPVIPGADPAIVVQNCLKFSPLWPHFKQLKLTSNVRSVDPVYSEWLIKLGNGELGNDVDLPDDLIPIPEEMLATTDIWTEIFGDHLTPENVEQYKDMAILCPRNRDADFINSKVLDILEGEESVYLSSDSLCSDDLEDIQDYPTEFLNTLNPSGSSQHVLKLKRGAIIMLLRNLNTNFGLCNGTRLVVTDLHRNLIVAKVLTGSAKGQIVFIPRIDLITDADLPFQLRRKQFPVKLAFAMTINKSQGQTLDKVGIYLADPVFSHGQLYVAFSRVRQGSNIKVCVCDTPEQGKLIKNSEIVYTRNVVYKSVL